MVLGVGKGVITVLAVKLSQTTAMVRPSVLPTRCRHAVMFYLIQSTVCVYISRTYTYIFSHAAMLAQNKIQNDSGDLRGVAGGDG